MSRSNDGLLFADKHQLNCINPCWRRADKCKQFINSSKWHEELVHVLHVSCLSVGSFKATCISPIRWFKQGYKYLAYPLIHARIHVSHLSIGSCKVTCVSPIHWFMQGFICLAYPLVHAKTCVLSICWFMQGHMCLV